MKKFQLFFLILAGILCCSCEDFYLEHQLDYEPTITIKRNFEYKMTDADYSSLAKNETNIATALAMGATPTDSSFVTLLNNVGTDKAFLDTLIAPEVFIPAFLASKYPHLSAGTLCEVTYRATADLPIYFEDFKIIREFTPKNEIDDIEDIPATMDAEIHRLLKVEGYIYLVNYRDDEAYLYTYHNKAFVPYENSMIDIYPLTQKDYEELGERYLTDPEYSLNLLMHERFPYAKPNVRKGIIYKYQDADEKYHTSFGQLDFTDNVWVLLPTISEEVMSFEMQDAWKANLSTFLSEPFLGHGQGNFVIQNVFLEDPLTYVWYYSSTYGMCASAYKENASHTSEAWLVSPLIKLKKAKNPHLIFDQAFNKATNFTEEATVLVSTDYKGDVTTCTWTPLEWNLDEKGNLNVPPGSSWVFQSTGNLDMTRWIGEKVYLGFRYTTKNGISGTWEIKNVLVYDPVETPATDESTESTESDAE